MIPCLFGLFRVANFQCVARRFSFKNRTPKIGESKWDDTETKRGGTWVPQWCYRMSYCWCPIWATLYPWPRLKYHESFSCGKQVLWLTVYIKFTWVLDNGVEYYVVICGRLLCLITVASQLHKFHVDKILSKPRAKRGLGYKNCTIGIARIMPVIGVWIPVVCLSVCLVGLYLLPAPWT